MKEKFAGMRYGDLKKTVAEMIVSHLEPIQKKFEELTADRDVIRGILKEGAERVTPIAQATMDLVRQRTGLYRG
jgi:tryptophanyl-tRNA synthetase